MQIYQYDTIQSRIGFATGMQFFERDLLIQMTGELTSKDNDTIDCQSIYLHFYEGEGMDFYHS
jgi:hypothetical protein